MTRSEIIHCCWRKKRHVLVYLYILIVACVLIMLLSSTRQSIGEVLNDLSEPRKKIKPLNIFEKWYRTNRRSLLEEEDEYIGFTNLFKRSNSSKQTTKLEDITKYYGSHDAKTRQKVNSILDSFAFTQNTDFPPFECQSVLEGEEKAILRSKLANLEFGSKLYELKRRRAVSSLERIREMVNDCDNFKKERQYITIPLSKEEAMYPIAYIITIHRDLPSFERLLRSVYHPQNLYCVHIDSKSDQEFKDVVSSLTSCFDNIFIASNLTAVRYTHWSRVQADLNCMKDLVGMAEGHPWKYVINLCGQDFPIKTNHEIVRALKNLQGFNNLETFKTPQHKKKRYEVHFELPRDPKHDHSLMKRTDKKKKPPPNGIEMFAGSAYYIFKKQAIEFMMTDAVLQEFFAWNMDTYSPDEHMWATIQRMFPQLPGSFPPHEKYDLNELQTITRIVKWGGLDKKVYPKCEGRFVRGVCVYGCGDLAWLVTQKHIFANKFDPEVDFLAIHCLGDWIRNRTIDQAKKYFARGFL